MSGMTIGKITGTRLRPTVIVPRGSNLAFSIKGFLEGLVKGRAIIWAHVEEGIIKHGLRLYDTNVTCIPDRIVVTVSIEASKINETPPSEFTHKDWVKAYVSDALVKMLKGHFPDQIRWDYKQLGTYTPYYGFTLILPLVRKKG